MSKRRLLAAILTTTANMSPMTGCLRGDRRVVTVDLGEAMTVRRVEASFFQNKGWGVYFPETVTFAISQNGTAWTQLGTVSRPVDLSVAGSFFEHYHVDGFNYVGRRVKQALEQGQTGEVLAIKGTNHGRMPGGWFTDPDLAGGGAVLDHTVHVADLIRWLLGKEFTSVYAE